MGAPVGRRSLAFGPAPPPHTSFPVIFFFKVSTVLYMNLKGDVYAQLLSASLTHYTFRVVYFSSRSTAQSTSTWQIIKESH